MQNERTPRGVGSIAKQMAAFVVALSVVAGVVHAQEQPVGRPLQLADLTGIEAIGRGVFDAQGFNVVWEQAPPYDTLREFWAPPWVNGGFQLRIRDTRDPMGTTRTLDVAGGPTALWVGAFSPSARYLSILGRIDGQFRAGVYDIHTGETRWFASLPQGQFTSARQMTWLDDEHLVLLASDGQDGDAIHKRIFAEWQAANAGQRPTAAVVDSPSPRPTREYNVQPQSRVVVVDLPENSESVIATGRFRQIAVSADRTMLALESADWLGRPREYLLVSPFQPERRELVAPEDARWSEILGWWSIDQEEFRRSYPRTDRDGPIAIHEASGSRLLLTSYDDGRRVELARDGELIELSRANTRLEHVQRPMWRRIEYVAQIGDQQVALSSVAVLPQDFQVGRRYPVIVHIYPGSEYNDFANLSYAPERIGDTVNQTSMNLFAAHDYIVYYISNPSRYTNPDNVPLQNLPVLVDAALDALVDQGYADADRVGLYGFSQGGYTALWLAVHSTRFKAVVAANSWADPIAQTFDTPGFGTDLSPNPPYMSLFNTRWENTGSFSIGGTPFENTARYIEASPLFRSNEIQVPILLMHSDFDEFSIDQFERMFTALLRQEKRARFIRYLGEGHGNSSPANIRHEWANLFAWYDQYLDVARDEMGSVTWDGDQVRGWGGERPFEPEQYYQLERIFGMPPAPSPPEAEAPR